MDDTKKTIELIRRLEEVFPGNHISVEKSFDKYSSSNVIDIVSRVYVASVGHSDALYGLPAIEAYVDMIIVNKVIKEAV